MLSVLGWRSMYQELYKNSYDSWENLPENLIITSENQLKLWENQENLGIKKNLRKAFEPYSLTGYSYMNSVFNLMTYIQYTVWSSKVQMTVYYTVIWTLDDQRHSFRWRGLLFLLKQFRPNWTNQSITDLMPSVPGARNRGYEKPVWVFPRYFLYFSALFWIFI